MKKAFLYVLMIALAISSVGQTCTKFQKGQVMKTTVNAYMCTLPFAPDWAKLKEEKKAEKILAFNNSVLSGTEATISGGTYDFLIKDISTDDGGDRILVQADISGYIYTTVMACKNDIMYFTRNAGPVWGVTNGDTTGFLLQGVQAIPNVLKIGDVLQPYEDVTFGLPSVNEITVSWPEFQGYEKSIHYETGLGYNLKSSEWAYGKWEVTETKAIYENIDVKVKQIFKPTYHAMHYLNARVSAQEEVTIDGTKYNAFVIESESWVKYKVEASYESVHADCEAYYNKIMADADKSTQKKNVKSGITNEQGYMVTYKTEWFVPGIGVVKSTGYDLNGFINLIAFTQSIK